MPAYPRGDFRFDLVAGLTASAVVIPQAMAYATIAGLPVEVGLYTALMPMVIYAVLGTSRPLSVSTTSTIAMLTATTLAGVGQSSDPYDYIIPAATLAFLVGVFLLLAGVLRLGFIANFISDPVLTGFKAGIGVVIFVGQLGKVLGLSLAKGPILQTIVSILDNLDQISWPTVLISAITLAILILLPRWTKRVPAAMIAVGFGILASILLNTGALGIKLVGPIPAGLPSLTVPDLSLFSQLWVGALGIGLMSFVESIAAARAFTKHGDQIPAANQELLALGAANIGGGLTSAMPGGGGTSQTAVNDQAGARSQLAGIVNAAVVLITLLFLAPLISLMPQATLGALVLVAAAGLVKLGEFRKIRNVRRTEWIWAVVAFFGVIILGTLQGILVAVILSILALLYLASNPPVYRVGRKVGTDVFRALRDHPDDETFPGLLMLRTEGVMFFASAPHAIDQIARIAREHQPKIVVLDCSPVPNFEYTSIKQFLDFDDKLQTSGVTLWLAALNREAFETIEKTELGKALGHERMFFNLEQAVEVYLERL
ncbi:MAG: sulfate permease [Anaerolineales bacterium]|nr:sulfate permease [Anaerolineales bacterium]